MSQADARPRAAAVLEIFPLTETQKDQLAAVIVAHVDSAVAQAVAERDSELANLRVLHEANCHYKHERDQQADEIARLNQLVLNRENWSMAEPERIQAAVDKERARERLSSTIHRHCAEEIARLRAALLHMHEQPSGSDSEGVDEQLAWADKYREIVEPLITAALRRSLRRAERR